MNGARTAKTLEQLIAEAKTNAERFAVHRGVEGAKRIGRATFGRFEVRLVPIGRTVVGGIAFTIRVDCYIDGKRASRAALSATMGAQNLSV